MRPKEKRQAGYAERKLLLMLREYVRKYKPKEWLFEGQATFQKFKALKDSIFSSENKSKITELETKKNMSFNK